MTVNAIITAAEDRFAGLTDGKFHDAGIRLHRPKSLEQALSIISNENIGLIIIDADNTEFPFLDFLHDLAGMDNIKSTPVVAVTVANSATMRETLNLAGCEEILKLPMPNEIFVEKLKSIIGTEIRAEKRFSSDGFGRAEMTSENVVYLLPIVNLSRSGMFVATDMDIEVGREVILKFDCGVLESPIITKAHVVRASGQLRAGKQAGIALQFCQLTRSDENRLDHTITSLEIMDPEAVFWD